jgi:hypothetical protein
MLAMRIEMSRIPKRGIIQPLWVVAMMRHHTISLCMPGVRIDHEWLQLAVCVAEEYLAKIV